MKSCREIADAVLAEGWSQPSLPEWAATRLHLMLCRHCARLARQIRQIGRASRCAPQEAAPAGLEDRILERLRRN